MFNFIRDARLLCRVTGPLFAHAPAVGDPVLHVFAGVFLVPAGWCAVLAPRGSRPRPPGLMSPPCCHTLCARLLVLAVGCPQAPARARGPGRWGERDHQAPESCPGF